jgi:S-adenosylmethionine-diacylgycerolhomoserine-N-methlytransferase
LKKVSDAAALMDRMYRRQRHIYDLSRKFYLLGRDEAIARVRAAPGDTVIEIGCGTGRNLVKLARAYPEARLFGLDVSREMLLTAAASVARAGLSQRIALARGDAASFEPQGLFGRAGFDRVVISYALSMIPPWREALAHALDVLSPGGSLHLVDFGDCAGLPPPFRTGLRRWLAAFDVTPRDDLGDTLEALSAERGLKCATEPWRRGYALLAVARQSA